jgi:DNA-binding transcriptional LysR family regulator
MIGKVETRRLQLLVELSRLGSMRAVADHLGTTTSNVSQQLGALARDVGAALIEPEGRNVRLTPAGQRLAAHAVTILAAVSTARADLDPAAAPVGTVRVSGFATAIRTALMPTIADLAATHPDVHIVVREHEPAEAVALLGHDDIDLALTYDYNLAPASVDVTVETVPLWSTPWTLGVPAATAPGSSGNAPRVFSAFRGYDWIGNSRNKADEQVIHLLATMAGFEPRLTHEADSLDLVEDLILAGLGVGLLPADRPHRDGVVRLSLTQPDLRLRAYARTRSGRTAWPPLALVMSRLITGTEYACQSASATGHIPRS